MPRIIVTETLDQVCAKWLSQRVQLIWCSHENRDELIPQLVQADGLVVRTYTRVDAKLLERAPRLKVVGRAGVGLERIDLEACGRRGITVVYTPEANTQAVTEYVLGLMLDGLRPRHTLTGPVDAQTFHELRKQLGAQLDSLTLGILGFGRIGQRLGRIAHAIGMPLLVNDLLLEAELRQVVDYPFTFVDKPTLFRESDVLSVHVDSRPENQGMLGAQVFSQLKPSCLLINTARGMLVDNDALVQWARRIVGDGGQAILDVHEPEPIPVDYPLYDLPNVCLLPHIAASTDKAKLAMSWVVKDVWAVLNGREPKYRAT